MMMVYQFIKIYQCITIHQITKIYQSISAVYQTISFPSSALEDDARLNGQLATEEAKEQV
jgi:hypothetical protein